MMCVEQRLYIQQAPRIGTESRMGYCKLEDYYRHSCSPEWHKWLFFSSRRRHTRLPCDWSSDVCSSDLLEEVVAAVELPRLLALRDDRPGAGGGVEGGDPRPARAHALGERALRDELDLELPRQERSEERRVGNGGMGGRGPGDGEGGARG